MSSNSTCMSCFKQRDSYRCKSCDMKLCGGCTLTMRFDGVNYVFCDVCAFMCRRSNSFLRGALYDHCIHKMLAKYDLAI